MPYCCKQFNKFSRKEETQSLFQTFKLVVGGSFEIQILKALFIRYCHEKFKFFRKLIQWTFLNTNLKNRGELKSQITKF